MNNREQKTNPPTMGSVNPHPSPGILSGDRLRGTVCGVLAVAVAVGVAGIYLFRFTEIIGNNFGQAPNWFRPSVMIACGKGFTQCVEDSRLPGLEDFLEQRTQSLYVDRGVLPDLPVLPVPPFLECHRYLLYGVGLIWRLFGISWDGLKIFAAILFAATALIVYGLFRLGMNRPISLLGTAVFMLSPPSIFVLPCLRDYAKVPFILGAILIMGYLLKNPVSRRRFWALAALLGVVTGVGFGFRQDLLVMVPVAILVAGLCARGRPRLPLRDRCVAVAILIVCFLGPAWPVLSAMQAASDRNTAHSLIQGFAISSLEILGLKRASYDVIGANDDFFIYATVSSYDHRTSLKVAAPSYFPMSQLNARSLLAMAASVVCPAESLGWLLRKAVFEPIPIPIGGSRMYSESIEQAGRRFLGEIVTRFPGDVITRWETAVLRVLRTVDGGTGIGLQARDPFLARAMAIEKPLRTHLDRYGPFYAAATLLLISSQSLLLGVSALFLVFYLCGYSSLLFQMRHAFHLEVFALWSLGFLIGQAFRALRLASPRRFAETARALWSARKERIAFPLGRMALLSLIAVVLAVLPLHNARAHQNVHAARILRQYAEADLEALEVQPKEIEDRVVFCARGGLYPDLPSVAPRGQVWLRELEGLPTWQDAVLASYLMAEFTAPCQDLQVWLQYQGEEIRHFTTANRLAMFEGPKPVTVRYFFPVYELGDALTAGPVRFLGFGLDKAVADNFKGLYRVRNADEFPLWLNIAIPSDLTRFKRYQTLPPLWPGGLSMSVSEE